MSAADTVFLNMATDNLRAFGEDAVFTPSVGDTVSLKVWLEQEVKLQVDGYESRVYAQEKTIEAVISHIGKVPARGETFTIGGTVYTVQSILENDGVFVKAVVK